MGERRSFIIDGSGKFMIYFFTQEVKLRSTQPNSGSFLYLFTELGFKSSRPEVSSKKGILRNIAKFMGKTPLVESLF